VKTACRERGVDWTPDSGETVSGQKKDFGVGLGTSVSEVQRRKLD